MPTPTRSWRQRIGLMSSSAQASIRGLREARQEGGSLALENLGDDVGTIHWLSAFRFDQTIPAMPALVAGIYACKQGVGGRDKPGHDSLERRCTCTCICLDLFRGDR